MEAINLLQEESSAVKRGNPSLSNLDAAVLSALRIASKKITISNEYKEDIFSLRSEVENAISLLKIKKDEDQTSLNN